MALAVLDLNKAIEFSQADFAAGDYNEDELDLLAQVQHRRQQYWADQQAFAAACDRWDSLYYPGDEGVIPLKGASHWAYHSSARLPGKAHISINTPPIYVDIPAALQAVPPIENVVPSALDSEQARQLASMAERLYVSWRDEIGFNMIGHRGCVVKGLYGHTAGKVWWDPDTGFPKVDIVDQPRNLWLGWGQSDYRTLDWAMYTYLMTPEAIFAQYGLVAVERTSDGKSYPYLMPAAAFGSWTMARRMMWQGGDIEVLDYWYRQPKTSSLPQTKRLRAVKHDTWNAIIVGNRIAQNLKFPEYDGDIPYIPLFNSFIPGVPTGRPELYDIEQLIREKDERLTSGSQLMHNIVNAQYWQLTGPEAPEQVPLGLRPKPNQVVAPGAGNRIEGITPWMPSFQLEEFMGRIDREMVDVSGLNDLLRGMAPASVMSSSKAINALVANYETRITMKRDVYFKWRKDMWYLARKVWAYKDKELAPILLGGGRLDTVAPSLTPRDDMETAQIARTLVDGKLWAAVRGMDRTGVDDPEAEQNIIRAEQTDVALNPASVQVIAAVATQLQAMGFQNAQQATQSLAGPGGAPGEPPPDEQQMAEMMRQQMGSAEGQSGSGEAPIPGQEALPSNVEGGAPGAGPPAAPGGPGEVMAQTMVKGGEATNRLLFQQPIEPGGTLPEEG